MTRRIWLAVAFILCSVPLLVACVWAAADQPNPRREQHVTSVKHAAAPAPKEEWAFEETFSGLKPSAPSQELLPKRFDYVVTARVKHEGETPDGRHGDPTYPFGGYGYFAADHGHDCGAGLPPSPLAPEQHGKFASHPVYTTHRSHGAQPDPAFFICNEHLMSANDDDEYYTIAAFYPRQEFNFAHGGVLEFDVNLTNQPNNWFEVMLVPRTQLQLGAARHWLPIDETYPAERIVFFFEGTKRKLQVGARQAPPKGMLVEKDLDPLGWSKQFPDDPALVDRRIRRTHRIELHPTHITWGIEQADGTFHTVRTELPGGLPFTQGLVVFKTHSLDPKSVGNSDKLTWHWDNIRFSGSLLAPYTAFEVPGVVNMESHYGGACGPDQHRCRVGDAQTVTVTLPYVGSKPVLIGQTHEGMPGHVLLSVNGHAPIAVQPHSQSSKDHPCFFDKWRTFRYEVDPALLRAGQNTLTWTIGPVPDCARGKWFADFTGFAVKALEIQFLEHSPTDQSGTATPTNTPTVTATTTTTPTGTVTVMPPPPVP